MNRQLMHELYAWKESTGRKPLIIQGARQVGKTWLMKTFGQNAFKQVIYLNFESSERLKNIFIPDFNIERILGIIEIEVNQKIDADNCLLIFDEIQEVEKGLTALKYFYELAPKYFIIAAGSLLGISLQKSSSFPVGKVDFLQLQPLSFIEFLGSISNEMLATKITKNNWEIIDAFHEKLIDALRLYYFIGGMPEVVANYASNNNLETVRALQQKILLGYENDFAKYAPNTIVPKIKMVWQAIISQLAKENRKFVFGQVKKGARAKDFEEAINWLQAAGLIIKVNRVSKPEIPLMAYEDFDAFKLFMVDIGLLLAMAKIDKKIILEKNNILTEFKGALTEQYVCQQLILKTKLYYWVANGATAEIDFLIQQKNEVVPIEVKAEVNTKSKSLKTYVEKYKPQNALRISMQKYKAETYLQNIPLYGVAEVVD